MPKLCVRKHNSFNGIGVVGDTESITYSSTSCTKCHSKLNRLKIAETPSEISLLSARECVQH